MATQGSLPRQSSRVAFAPSPSAQPILLQAVVSVLTVFLVFVLPLLIPGKPVHGISASYLAGFNNSVAVLATIGLSFAVLLGTFLQQRDHPDLAPPDFPSRTLGWRFTAAVITVSSAILGVAGALVTAAHQRYLGDAGYLIEQASAWSETGRKLYSQVEFAYGPILLLPEIWLARLTGTDITHAYFVVLVLQSALGLVFLAFLLNELPIRPRFRQIALILFALGAITPHLGLNYTFFRFASPLAFFLLALRAANTPLKCTALFSLAIILQCTIAPELAFVLASGILVYGCLRAWQSGPLWLVAGAVPSLVLAGLLLSVGHAYLRMVTTFSAGIYNLPIGPYPHILILLFAAVWLVPVYLGRTVSLGSPASARLLAFYIIALAMVPAALRRCDALHIFFNGVGLFLLSLAAVSQAALLPRRVWLTCLAFLVLWEHRVNEGLFAWRTAETVSEVVLPHTPAALRPVVIRLTALPDRNLIPTLRKPPKPASIPDMQALHQLVGNDPVATPLEIPPDLETALKSTHHYTPLYYAFGVDMMDEKAEHRAVDYLHQFRWMLVPTDRGLSNYQQYPKNLGPIQGIRMYFRQREPVLYDPGRAIESDLAQNWKPAATYGIYTLYRRSTGS